MNATQEEAIYHTALMVYVVLDGKFVPVASRGIKGPEGRPAKASEFVRTIHGCLRATSSPLSRGDRIFSLAVCYAGRLIGLFFKSNFEQKDTTRNRNSPDALTSVNFFKPHHAALVCFC